MFDNKTVLITGGAGSVGRSLVPQFLNTDLSNLRIFDNNEPSLSALRNSISDGRCRFLSGDIRDKDRLERAMQDVDIVVHTAAMKHVDVCEYNPFEAVKTNAVGLQNVVDTAIDTSVSRVVFTSSDKAVNPANTMGTTKLLGEKLITAGNKHAGRSDLRLSSVRFGNVINSSQSVIPLFAQQISDGGPVTLTDRRMSRFFLTEHDVFDLVTSAIEHMQGGEVFIYKMPTIRIEDLATAMIDVLAPEFGYDPENVDVEIIGRRVGETFHEEIITEREVSRTVENETLYAVLPETGEGSYLNHSGIDGFEEAADVNLSTEEADPLDVGEVKTLLRKNSVLENAL